jgi:hypothetical protein
MGRSLKVGALVAALFASFAAVCLAQSTAAPAAPSTDPLNALWALLGSSPVAGVLWLWAKSEREERRDMTRQMLSIFEADGQHKATLRERLKGQDDMLGKSLEATRALETRVLEAIRLLERRFDSSKRGDPA